MKNINLSSTTLMLMLLWLIGGSPPVRSRKILAFQQYQNTKPPDNNYDSIYNVTKYLDKVTLPMPKRNAVFNNSSIISDTKHAKTQNSSYCNEHRTLLQIVIDTPSIFEVTVVSKSVAGEQ